MCASVSLSSALWKNGGLDPGPGMRQVVRFGDRFTGRGTFGGKFGARHSNQWGLYGVRMRQCCDAALFPNYFGQTCYYRQIDLSMLISDYKLRVTCL